MSERTSYAPGTFSWVELATPDPDAAKGFYSALLGWEAEDNQIPESDAIYSMQKVDGRNAAAITSQPAEQRSAGVPPNWFSYVTVASVDESAAKVGELGGQVHAGPFDVMEAGRMAVVADPVGAMFGIWEANEAIGAEIVNRHGCLAWNDVATSDPDATERFYSGLFGWTFEEIETGEAGPRYWTIRHEGAAAGRNGGMRELTSMEEGVPPHWLPYFGVDDIDDSAARAEGLGARVVVPPTEVPNGAFAALFDPQGAAFSIVESDFDD